MYIYAHYICIYTYTIYMYMYSHSSGAFPILLSPPQFHAILFLLTLQVQLVCLHVQGMDGAVHWRMGNLPAAIPLKKNDLSSPGNSQLLVDPQLGRSLIRPPTMLEYRWAWSRVGSVQVTPTTLPAWAHTLCHVQKRAVYSKHSAFLWIL